ncbi:MAG: pseudouridine synthase [Succinivibrio sp.]|nr:pseudouridine synthase [Succinivibrio sp.]
MSDKLRLDKAVAHNYDVSRTVAAALIRQGRIRVNDEIITDAATKILLTDTIAFDEYEQQAEQGFAKRYFMLNKPAGMVCADRDRDLPIVLNLFYEQNHAEQLHCVGRLDQDTTGLLIVTDDGDFIHKVTSPKQQIPKVYQASVALPLKEHDIVLFARGLKHPDEKKRYAPAQLELLSERQAQVTVTEGRYHEVKRLFECIDNQVLELKRVQIGLLRLDEDLEEGEYRPLSAQEVQLIMQDNA